VSERLSLLWGRPGLPSRPLSRHKVVHRELVVSAEVDAQLPREVDLCGEVLPLHEDEKLPGRRALYLARLEVVHHLWRAVLIIQVIVSKSVRRVLLLRSLTTQMTQSASLKLRREDSLKTWRLQVAVLLAGHATEGVVAHAKELVLPHDLGHLAALLHLCDRVSYDIFVIELNAPLATTGELRVRRATRLAHYLLDATPHGGLRVCRAHGGHGPQIHTVEGVEKRLHFAPLCVRAPRWIRVPLLPAGSLGPEGGPRSSLAHPDDFNPLSGRGKSFFSR